MMDVQVKYEPECDKYVVIMSNPPIMAVTLLLTELEVVNLSLQIANARVDSVAPVKDRSL